MTIPPDLARFFAWLKVQEAYRQEQRRQEANERAEREMARADERVKTAMMNVRKDKRDD